MTTEERQEQERLRLAAAEMFSNGTGPAEVARALGASRQAAHAWRTRWLQGGAQALLSAGPSGARSFLDGEQLQQLKQELDKGPAAHGWADQRWTLARIGKVIEERFAVRYATPTSVWQVMKRIGWSWQAPQTVATERNDDALEAFRTEVWPRVKDCGGPGSLDLLRG